MATLLDNYDQSKFVGLPTGVLRAEMAVEAYNIYKDSPYALAKIAEVEEAGFVSNLGDLDSCTREEKEAILFFEKLGIANGYNEELDNGQKPFYPDVPASNLQTAVFLMQCAKLRTSSLQARTVTAAPLADQGPDAVTQELITQLGFQFGSDSEIVGLVTQSPNAPATETTLEEWGESLVPPAPGFNPPGGATFEDSLSVAITLTNPNANHYYTLDPDAVLPADGKIVMGPIPLDQTTTIRAVAVLNNLVSEEARATYTKLPALSISSSAASLSGGGTVTLTTSRAADRVTCSDTSIAVTGSGTAWTASLPNASGSYTFTAAAGEKTASCTVTVTYRSSGSSSSSSGDRSESNTSTSTERNPDGSTTTTTTDRTTGAVTETTRYPDGSREVVETQRDGTVTTTTTDQAGNQTATVENPDGSREMTVTNRDGSSSTTTVSRDGITQAQVTLSASALDDSAAVALPMPAVSSSRDRAEAPSVTLELPAGVSARVEVPVERVTPGTVAVLVRDDGSEEILKSSVPTENGVAATLSSGDTVKIVDNSKEFDDVPENHWSADAVDFASSRELFAGTSGTTFAPDAAMSRAMIVTVLARYDGVDTTNGDDWYSAGRDWAMERGVSDGSGMDESLTREQLATMLWRYAGSPAAETDLDGYADADAVHDYAREAMAWAVEEGVIAGTTGTTLSPQETATRAQVATILMRFIQSTAQ